MAVDIVAFGDPVRNDGILREMRHALYGAIDTAFARSGIDVDGRYAWQDRGDGALYVMPPTISTAQFVDPFLAELLAELREYNRNRTEKAQIKLRVALHLGTVHFDGYGVIGHALTRLFNLLEAPEFKTGIIALNADLGFITSDYLYDDVIRHGPGRVDPDAYHSIEVRDGNDARRAWMYFPPGLTPPSIGMKRVPAQGRMCS